MLIKIILFLSLVSISFAQNINYEIKAQKVFEINSMPYIPEYSGDTLYWDLVKDGLDIVPFLIEKLDDSSSTQINVELTGGYYTIADISNLIIWDIIRDLPVFQFTKSNKQLLDSCGICYYWDYIRLNQNNRKNYKEEVNNWFKENKNNLVWFVDEEEFKGGTHKFPRKHPAGGYYLLKK